MVDIDNVIARGIRAERSRLRMTQEDLGLRLGWSRQTISTIENEERRLTVAELTVVCRVLGVTFDWLIRDADPADRRTLGLEQAERRRRH